MEEMEMTVYKRGDRWSVDVCFPDGRRIKEVIGNKKEAEAVERKLKQEILEQKWQVRFLPKIKFREFLKEYFPYIKDHQSESTFSSNYHRIKKNILPVFGKSPLVYISKQKVDNYKLARANAGATSNTIRNELSCLSHIFKIAIRWGYLYRNPVEGVEKPKKPKQPPKFLTEKEEKKLLAKCEEHIYPIVITALNTGMRKGELLNLKWSDIDLTKKEVAIKSKFDWHTKNYDYRYVGINKKLLNVLSNLKPYGDYVFTYAGRRILDIKRSISTAYKNAKVNHHGQPMHILRHTFATRMLTAENPTTLEKLQQLMGHKDFSTTLQYAHLTSRSVKDEVNKLD